MRMHETLVVGLALVLACAWGPNATAQEAEPGAPEEVEPVAPPTDDAPPAVPDEKPAPEKDKFKIGLYVAVGGGLARADDLNTSILTDATRFASSSFKIDGLRHGVAAIGWKLPEGKGDFRLVFNGWEEQKYELRSIGAAAGLAAGSVNPACVSQSLVDAFAAGDIDADQLDASPGFVISPLGGACLYGWWNVFIKDGKLVSERTPAEWVFELDDVNGNAEGDPGEIRFLDSDRRIEVSIPDNLHNNLVTWDALYGREFGGRRFSSRWWGGLRVFNYEGQMLATAWLDPAAAPGAAFTDQAFLPLINLEQKTSGWGPTGAWEADFNFFDKGLAFYLRAETAFSFNTLEVDSHNLFTIIETSTDAAADTLAPIRIAEKRDKSSWQAGGELGVRVRLVRGFEFELGYGTRGFLDAALLPSTITIPKNPGQIFKNDPEATVSALYLSQDVKIHGWHTSVGFQF